MDEGQPKNETEARRKQERHGQGQVSGLKRDRHGKPKKAPDQSGMVDIPRNAYTSMFEGFKDDMDEHHNRRERIIKASRDLTATSKNIIFSLLRARTLRKPLPPSIEKEFRSRLAQVRDTLQSVLGDVQGINRYRYALYGLEEYVEAASLYHYIRHQTLISPDQVVRLLDLEEGLELTDQEYLGGVLDLSGEMMRFATNTAGLCGTLTPGQAAAGDETEVDDEVPPRSILSDMQELWSCLEALPTATSGKHMHAKMEVLKTSVQKVEKLGYSLVVRGSERPAGWVPGLTDDVAPALDG